MEGADQQSKGEAERDQVARIFENLGADAEAAKVMAGQLLKRAHQIADERDIDYLQALESLLKQVVEARRES